MKCSVAETIVTPEFGLPIPGYFNVRLSDSVKDDLYAQAMVIDDGKTVVALVSLDILRFDGALTKEVRRRVAEKIGIPGDNILVAATHTHTGGPTNYVEIDGVAVNETVVENLTRSVTDIIVKAYETREEATFTFGSDEVRGLSFNRVCKMQDGSYISNPGYRDDIECVAGEIDYTLGVCKIADRQGKIRGLAVNFACHPDTLGGTAYSGDWPGVLRRELKAEYGEDVVILPFNGCCGDVNHIDYIGKAHLVAMKKYAERIGTTLAKKVTEIVARDAESERDLVAAERTEYRYPRRQPTEADIAWSKAVLAREAEEPVHHIAYAKDIRDLVADPIPDAPVEIQAIRVGDVVFTGFPCEAFSCIGLNLRKKTAFRKNMIIELANNSLGYVPSAQVFGGKCYETKISKHNSFMPPETADMMSQTAADLHEKLCRMEKPAL